MLLKGNRFDTDCIWETLLSSHDSSVKTVHKTVYKTVKDDNDDDSKKEIIINYSNITNIY